MTTPPTDAELRAALDSFALLLGIEHDLPPNTPLGHKRLELLTIGQGAAKALLAARAKLREVHRRVVKDHYHGTSPDSPHYWSCLLCEWSWKHGEAELHEPTCPLAGLDAVLGEGT